MFLIQQVTADAMQKQNLVLSDGSQVSMTIYFRPMQFGWFITELIYQAFTLHEVRIVNSPNILNQFSNRIPFGLACFSKANREPALQQDFSSGNSQLYILSQAEVKSFTEFLKGG